MRLLVAALLLAASCGFHAPGSVAGRRRTQRAALTPLSSSSADEDDGGAAEDPDEAARIAAFREKLMGGGGFAAQTDADIADKAAADAAAETARVEAFRAKMAGGGGGAGDAAAAAAPALPEGEVGGMDDMWAVPCDAAAPGMLLLAQPGAWGISDVDVTRPDLKASRALWERVGTSPDAPLAAMEMPVSRRAELLPTVIVTEHGPLGSSGLVLNRRTGYLMGDLANLDASGFMIQPLNLGGADKRPVLPTGGCEESDEVLRSVTMVHPCATVRDAAPLGAWGEDDGLFIGGDYASAREEVQKGESSGHRFRFFVQSCRWGPGGLQKELDSGAWTGARASREVLLKSRTRSGPRRTKPLWLDAMELLGGDAKARSEPYR